MKQCVFRDKMQRLIFVAILGLSTAHSLHSDADTHASLPQKMNEWTFGNEQISQQTTTVYTCDATNSNNSFIYCSGDLLKAVNFHSMFNDSKTFVDMPMKKDPVEVLDAFKTRFAGMTVEQIKRDDLQVFLDEFFAPPGSELEECELQDWTPNPPQLMSIDDPKLRQFALDLNAIWKVLCRKVRANVTNWDRHSLIRVPNEFVAPGGRFREYYYWDAYWIIKGLLASGMNHTAKAMILNLGSTVQTYGFVPNGGRVYYLERSQPPLLCGMVYDYVQRTQDFAFLDQMLPILVKEFDFWQNNRNVNVTGRDGHLYSVFRYRTPSNVPRPESYRVDVLDATKLPQDARPAFYQHVASAAESGWDFSSRWFSDGQHMTSIETADIAPVDLNAIMCWNMDILEYLFKRNNQLNKSKQYRDMRKQFMYAMQFVFFNDTVGAWLDLNTRTKQHNPHYYASVAVPLFGDCYQLLNTVKPQRIYNYMDKLGVFNYPGGVPTSLRDTNQQWDFPNGWSPMNHFVIEGLRKSQNPEMQEQAYKLAEKWINGNYKVYNATEHMWEKYDVTGEVPKPGLGGEYSVQPGFGWTNGAALDLLVTYRDRIHIVDSTGPTQTAPVTTTTTSAAPSTLMSSFSLVVLAIALNAMPAA